MENGIIQSTRGERSQVIGWYVQVVGTMAMLLGLIVALGALPEVVDGRFIKNSDFTPFFTRLIVALVVGFGLMIVGIIVGSAGRAQTTRDGGQSRPLREVLSKPKKAIGLLLITVCFVAFIAKLIFLLLSLGSNVSLPMVA